MTDIPLKVTEEDRIINGFNYGKRKADGQYERYPTSGDPSRPFVRPVRMSYIHEKCGVETRMSLGIAETYAQNPKFYGSTFCIGCGTHFPVGAHGEFHWADTPDEKVGT